MNQLPFVTLAKKMGYHTITMDNVPSNIAHTFSDEQAFISTVNKEKVLDFAREANIDAVVTCASDLALSTMAYVSKALGLNAVPEKSVSQTVNKGNFREFLLKNSFNVPHFFLFSSEKDALDKIQGLKGKWILKPTDSSGSKGVCLLQAGELNQGVKTLVKNAFSFSQTNQIILEEFIEGENYSIDGFINEKQIEMLVVTNKLLTPLPLRTPIAHLLPGKIIGTTKSKISSLVKDILSKLAVVSTPFDFDIVVDKSGKIYFLEMSLRIGGNGIPRLVKYSESYDLYKSALLCALGETIPTHKKKIRHKQTGVFLIYSDKKGVVTSFKDSTSLMEEFSPILKEVVFDVAVGDNVEAFVSGNHRLGHYILQTSTRDQLLQASKKVMEKISLKVTKEK